jgi:hypothetical protein
MENFKTDKLIIPSLFLLLGTSHSGKSHMLKYLIQEMAKRFNYGFVFSGTIHNGQYNFIPKDCQFSNSISKEWLDKLLTHQKKQMANGTPAQCFLIIDDLIGRQDFYDEVFQILSTTGRHYNITTFILAQGVKCLSPIIRNNAHYVFIFKMSNVNSINQLFQEYSVGYSRPREFISFIEASTQNYQCVFIDKRSPITGKDSYQIVKAPFPLPDYRLKF